MKSRIFWMRWSTHAAVAVTLSALLIALPAASFARVPGDKWNYDGGLAMLTNGSLPNGICFRLAGKVTAPGFFDDLKRIDTHEGATFKHKSETVTKFPDQLLLVFVIRDFYDKTCPPRDESEPRQYLTRAIMSTLQLSLYWKHGVELRPIENPERKYFSVDPVIPYAAAQVHDLPARYEWSYEFAVPSAGVPLTDSLVLILRTPDGHLAARVAARL